MTSSEDHFRAAEKLLEEAESHREPDTRAEWCLELAKMHLALSQLSQVTSPGPSGEYPQSGSLPGHTDPDTAGGPVAHTPVHDFVDPRTPGWFEQGSQLGRERTHSHRPGRATRRSPAPACRASAYRDAASPIPGPFDQGDERGITPMRTPDSRRAHGPGRQERSHYP